MAVPASPADPQLPWSEYAVNISPCPWQLWSALLFQMPASWQVVSLPMLSSVQSRVLVGLQQV